MAESPGGRTGRERERETAQCKGDCALRRALGRDNPDEIVPQMPTVVAVENNPSQSQSHREGEAGESMFSS